MRPRPWRVGQDVVDRDAPTGFDFIAVPVELRSINVDPMCQQWMPSRPPYRRCTFVFENEDLAVTQREPVIPIRRINGLSRPPDPRMREGRADGHRYPGVYGALRETALRHHESLHESPRRIRAESQPIGVLCDRSGISSVSATTRNICPCTVLRSNLKIVRVCAPVVARCQTARRGLALRQRSGAAKGSCSASRLRETTGIGGTDKALVTVHAPNRRHPHRS
jgi:hypothetical protein